MKFPQLRAAIMSLLAISALAACSSGTTGMPPANPQTQSLSQTPNRTIGSAISTGSSAVAIASAGATRSGATSSSPLALGSHGGATPQFTENGPPASPPWPTGGGAGGGTGGGGGQPTGCYILTRFDRPAGNCPGSGGSPCYTGQGGPGCVASAPVAAPLNGECDDSPSEYATGTGNLPATSNSWATTVGNVFGFVDPEGSIYGWVYETEDQHIYFQRNPANTGVQPLASFFDSIPGLSATVGFLLDATTTPYELTGQQWNNISGALRAGGWNTHKCYQKMYQPPSAS